nr:MAG TPA: hypothetical protein [Caudoviricetes sp.]
MLYSGHSFESKATDKDNSFDFFYNFVRRLHYIRNLNYCQYIFMKGW